MAAPTIISKSLALVENMPLYFMLGIGCGLAIYTPIRHLRTASDIALDRQARDFADDLGQNPRALERAKHYEGGILGAVASIKSWPEVLHPPKSIPHDHFSYGRWPQPRPFTVPQPTN